MKSGRKLGFADLAPAILFLLISLWSFLDLRNGGAGTGLAGNMSQLGTDIINIASNPESAAMAGTRRFIKWMDTLKRIRQRPLFGFGPEGFYGVNAIAEGDAPHNEYLQIAGYLGIPGLLLYLGALVTLAVHHWKRIRELDPMVLAVSGATVVYLFSACFGNPVYNTAPYYWMFLGLTTATRELEKPLLCVDDDVDSSKDAKGKTTIVLAGIVLVIAALGARLYMELMDEKINEFADLQAMRNAELTVEADYVFKELDGGGTFWYNAENYMLIPEDQPQPLPYGLGRPICGNTWYDFSERFGKIYDYDESTDYTDKIICVKVGYDNDGKLLTDIRWVSVQ
jgi:hypothetical protein